MDGLLLKESGPVRPICPMSGLAACQASLFMLCSHSRLRPQTIVLLFAKLGRIGGSRRERAASLGVVLALFRLPAPTIGKDHHEDRTGRHDQVSERLPGGDDNFSDVVHGTDSGFKKRASVRPSVRPSRGLSRDRETPCQCKTYSGLRRLFKAPWVFWAPS